ncbi:hypothetical protein SNE25_13030 [Mucilaginibacter sabulilitoris]|uniref:HNH endonuclease 5 domain-containing protein n=1 Tax=Mucilaginibacter sabulilitoris TaxID=1173583 RepID=A0ABZ0TU46_9SPHI|nr:hypothetical protein [Mucilaginibacter sabulilitoris]WPU96444.1 hypothetical protein SNE25_13030 [Mucilaginibacter sabulilitoris]
MKTITVYIGKEDRTLAETFREFYEPYAYQGTLEGNLRESRKLKKETMACRFCKKSRAETTFSQDTHLISKLLGKNTYYSHDECDTCNQQFRLFENDLAAYLGTSRVFNHMIAGTSAPGFESANGQIKIKKKNDLIWLEKKGDRHDDLKIDLKNGKAAIKMETQLFRPENVYKALLKMAMGILPEIDRPDYNAGFKFLLHMENYPELTCFKRALLTETDIVIARPFAQLFKKLESVTDERFPQHLFCLSVGNLAFQLALPGHREFHGTTLQGYRMAIAPYIQLNSAEPHDGVVRGRKVEDLRSTEQKSNDHSMHFEFPTENLAAVQLDFDIGELFKNKS